MRAPGRLSESGGHPELVGEGGLRFVADEEIPGRPRPARRGARRTSRGDLGAHDLRRRRPVPRGAGSAHLESRGRGELPQRGLTAARFRVGSGSTVRRSSARTTSSTSRTPGRGHVARRAGAQEPARSLGLPGDHGRDATRADRRDRDVPRGQRALPRVDVRPARRGEVVSIDIEPPREDYPAASADHVPRGRS